MTKLKNRWLLWILPLAFFVSCKSNEGQWENKQISFPENIVFTKDRNKYFEIKYYSKHFYSMSFHFLPILFH